MPPQLPDSFLNHYGPLIDDLDAFTRTVTSPPPKTLRVNTLKATRGDVVARLELAGVTCRPVPWYDDALYVDDTVMSATLERFLGTIYIQELASMLPPLIARDELARAATVLDACAAPGSKTTEAAAFMHNRGCLVANDRSYTRIRALKFNLNKAGVINALITNFEVHLLPPMTFDVILLDAPCSSDGTIRKSPNLLATWSPDRSIGYGSRQKDMIVRCFDRLNPGGTMIYSTCSLSPAENEQVIDHLLRNREARMVRPDLPGFRFAPPVMEWNGREHHPDVAHTARVWPHHNDTDGFFVAKVVR